MPRSGVGRAGSSVGARQPGNRGCLLPATSLWWPPGGRTPLDGATRGSTPQPAVRPLIRQNVTRWHHQVPHNTIARGLVMRRSSVRIRQGAPGKTSGQGSDLGFLVSGRGLAPPLGRRLKCDARDHGRRLARRVRGGCRTACPDRGADRSARSSRASPGPGPPPGAGRKRARSAPTSASESTPPSCAPAGSSAALRPSTGGDHRRVAEPGGCGRL